jgi:hypothetical protein
MQTVLCGPLVPKKQTKLAFVTIILFLVAALYLGRGFYSLVFKSQTNPAIDLHKRWIEQRYVYGGQNPYDVVELVAAERAHLPPPECSRDNRVNPEIGPPFFRQGGYPPWAFVTAVLLVLPISFEAASTYFALLDIIALAVIAGWAYRLGRFHSRLGALFLVATSLAPIAHYNTLFFGQYGILVVALLVAVYFLYESHKPAAAGFMYGLATIKPTVSGLFVIYFLIKRQWRFLLVASAYVASASLVTWALTKTNPVEMLQQVQNLAHRWTLNEWNLDGEGHPVGTFHLGTSTGSSLFMQMGLNFKMASLLAGGLGLVATLTLTWLWRSGSTLTLFAIAATFGRMWAYHRPTDDVMMIFLLVGLGRLVLIRGSLSLVFAFSAVGLSLWLPTTVFPVSFGLWVEVGQVLSWLFGLTVLLAWLPPAKDGRPQPEQG